MSLKISTETTFLLDMIHSTYGPELHISANAASDPYGNEANATTGWTQTGLTGTGSNVFESQSSVKNTGSYALHANCNDTPTASAQCKLELTVTAGATYRLTFDWRHVGSGGNWACTAESSLVGQLANTATSFAPVAHEETAVGTTFTIIFIELSGTNNGGVYIDNLSLKKVL